MNEYFSVFDRASPDTLIRSAYFNGIVDSIIAGFDKLPAASAILEDRMCFCSSAGAANVYTLTSPGQILAYNAGLRVTFLADAANTGSTTINLNTIGAVALKRQDGSNLIANDIVANAIVMAVYDGVKFQLISSTFADVAVAAASAAAANASASSASSSASSASSSATSASGSATASAASATSSSNSATASAASAVASAASASATLGATIKKDGTTTTTAAIPFALGILGTTTNDNAASGAVGEYLETVVAKASAVSLTSGVVANVATLSLTAGDWDVSGVGDFTGAPTSTIVYWSASISTTSATKPTLGKTDHTDHFLPGGTTPFSTTDISALVGPVRISLAATTTVYLVAQATFGVSTVSAFGHISARRAR